MAALYFTIQPDGSAVSNAHRHDGPDLARNAADDITRDLGREGGYTGNSEVMANTLNAKEYAYHVPIDMVEALRKASYTVNGSQPTIPAKSESAVDMAANTESCGLPGLK